MGKSEPKYKPSGTGLLRISAEIPLKNSPKPEIGKTWPSKGMYLPTAEVFIDSVRKLTSYKSLEVLLNKGETLAAK